jgi:exosortase A
MSQSPESAISARPDWPEGWKTAVLVFSVCILVVSIAYWSTYAEIVSIWWRSETYAHGFVILPIVGYLIWQKREELSKLTVRVAPGAIFFLAGAVCLWLLGFAADIALAQHLAAVTILPILAWLIFGSAVASCIAFPLGYLIFAVPIGDFLVEPMQDITAAFSVWALQVTGIPVYWEGRFFHIPTGSFEVAEACSGVRYLIASLALGTLYAYLTYVTLWRRLIFVGLAILVPIIANGIRAYGIVMLAHLSDYKLAVGVDHIIYGWLFFGLVIMLLFWAGSLFREKDSGNLYEKASVTKPVTASVNPRLLALWAILAAGLTISAPILASWLEAEHANIAVKEPILPEGKHGWHGPNEITNPQWHPKFVGAMERFGSYDRDGKQVQVYLAYYPMQRQGEELINWQNHVYDEDQTRRLSEGHYVAQLADNRKWRVLTTQVETKGGPRLVWHWYNVEGAETTSRLMAKVHEMRGRLSASKRGSAAWVISTDYELVPGEAEQVLSVFLKDMLPAMQETLAQ